ncbi:MAG: glycoside hydrolase family 9 protein [Bacteroidota bacterium]
MSVRQTLFLALMLYGLSLSGQSISPFIHIDQFGYHPEATKVAVISNPIVGFNGNLSYAPPGLFEIRNANDDSPIGQYAPEVWNAGGTHFQSGDQGWWLDFSDLTTIGQYYLIDPVSGERSGDFRISEDVYTDILKTAGRAFYYNRCNMEKALSFAETGWTDATSFLNPLQDGNCRYIYDPDNLNLEKDLSGGWFDAGDYNKYVTFAYPAVMNLLWAYEENPQAFGDNWDIPESGNGIPDILDEVKWELDWLIKMNNADGSTHIKMGSTDFSDNDSAPPSANFDQRFYGPTCSSASIAVAGMFALASSIFDDFAVHATYSQSLRTKAQMAWAFVSPLITNNQLEVNCDDGSILAGDADWDATTQVENALVAAIHLFDLTGNSAYQDYITNNASSVEPVSNTFWGCYKMPLNDALVLYAQNPSAEPNTATQILNALQTDASNNWNGYYGLNTSDLYRAFMPDWSYHWGSNQPKANYGILNTLVIKADILGNQANFHSAAEAMMHYFHGVNPLGMVMLSNMYDYGGDNCVNEIYHTWFQDGSDWDHALNSAIGPAPGFVTGGPNAQFSVPALSPPSSQPLQKSYLDFNDNWPNNSWEISEPAIYYQAAYVRLLANFVDQSIVSVSESEEREKDFQVFPNPAGKELVIYAEQLVFDVVVLSPSGQKLRAFSNVKSGEYLDISNFPQGVLLFQILDDHSEVMAVKKVVRYD